jgi:hypothetical protein
MPMNPGPCAYWLSAFPELHPGIKNQGPHCTQPFLSMKHSKAAMAKAALASQSVAAVVLVSSNAA